MGLGKKTECGLLLRACERCRLIWRVICGRARIDHKPRNLSLSLFCSSLSTFSPRAASQAALQPGNLASALAREISRLGVRNILKTSKTGRILRFAIDAGWGARPNPGLGSTRLARYAKGYQVRSLDYNLTFWQRFSECFLYLLFNQSRTVSGRCLKAEEGKFSSFE